jgi:hypothetical protein
LKIYCIVGSGTRNVAIAVLYPPTAFDTRFIRRGLSIEI